MADFLPSSAFFAVLLTIGAYQAGLLLQRKCKSSLCNPIVIAVILVILALKVLGIANRDYQQGSRYINFLLTPATICLAVPLYQQLSILKRHWLAILAGIVAGCAASIASIIALSGLFGFDHRLYVSLLPKSVTTAMGLALSEQAGGVGAISTSVIIITGILGSLIGLLLARLLRISHPIARGVAFGTSAHVVGTAKAAEDSELAGAVSSLSLVVAGILTAIVFPFAISVY